MKRLVPSIIVVALLFGAHVYSLGQATNASKSLPKGEGTSYAVPAPILKITALEFNGLASDYAFLEAMVFVGSTFERTEQPRIKPWEWKWLYSVLDASSSLDPYFFDPYYFANANLTWAGNMARETNRLLERGSQYRDWDWMLPFFIGFNYYYFLQENVEASKYLMEASRRTGGSHVLASLASRLAYKEKQTEQSILFLDEIIKNTANNDSREYYETRREVLRSILVLEKAVDSYRARFGALPHDLNQLVTKHIISEIPRDPYGGSFYLADNGAVKSTSDSLLLPFRHPRYR